MKLSRLACTGVLVLASVLSSGAQDQWLAVTDVTVFDGLGEVYEGATVLVKGDRIEKIGEASSMEIPAAARRLEATGKFVVPGFVDLHFHYDPVKTPWLPLHRPRQRGDHTA